ncbi:MAG: hypothetical protein ACLU5I_04615 [Alistipes finegoldii]
MQFSIIYVENILDGLKKYMDIPESRSKVMDFSGRPEGKLLPRVSSLFGDFWDPSVARHPRLEWRWNNHTNGTAMTKTF